MIQFFFYKLVSFRGNPTALFKYSIFKNRTNIVWNYSYFNQYTPILRTSHALSSFSDQKNKNIRTLPLKRGKPLLTDGIETLNKTFHTT